MVHHQRPLESCLCSRGSPHHAQPTCSQPLSTCTVHAAGGYGTATYQQPAPQYNANRGGPTVKNEAAAKILPITALNAYQTRWHIKARVTSRSEMRRSELPGLLHMLSHSSGAWCSHSMMFMPRCCQLMLPAKIAHA